MARRRRTRGLRTLGVVLLLVGLPVGLGVQSGAITSAQLDRGSGVDVASDPSGDLGIDENAQLCLGNRDRLYDLTNRFDVALTVTIAADSSDVTLYAGGDSGQSVTFTLGAGATETVDVTVSHGGGGGPGGPGGPGGGGGGSSEKQFTTDIDGTTAGLSASATRSHTATIQNC